MTTLCLKKVPKISKVNLSALWKASKAIGITSVEMRTDSFKLSNIS